MEKDFQKSDGLFLLGCFALGILAEEAFFRGLIGISALVFTAALYGVFFWRFRGFAFADQRLGYLIVICVWLLSVSFYTSNNHFFYVLNLLAVPCLIFFHFLLITRPKMLSWNERSFIFYSFFRVIEAIRFNFIIAAASQKFLKGNKQKTLVWKKVLSGVILSIPVLVLVLYLLSSADDQFKQMIGNLPEWLNKINPETIFRLVVILGYTFFIFGFLSVLQQKKVKVYEKNSDAPFMQMDAVVALTVLVLLNAVYLLFTVVQFHYFFGGVLQESFTYAQYARKGFFELLAVSIINLTLTVVILSRVIQPGLLLKKWLQSLLTMLIVTSGVILTSAFLRMYLYEKAYGFTFTRVLAHSFMLFLAVIFAYTLLKIWMEKLSLFHFYFLSALIYYTGINVIDLDRLIVQQNIARYEQTGKIDLHYLNNLSYTGVLGLVQLHQINPALSGLKEILQERKKEALTTQPAWQSTNLKQQQAYAALKKLP